MKSIHNKVFASIILSILLSTPLTVHAAGRIFQAAQSYDFPAFSMALAGAGTLTRSKKNVMAQLALSDLDMASAYTVWWVVFNHPEACAGGVGHCALVDLDSPEVAASVFYATGFITDTNTTANVTAHMDAGKLPQGLDVLIPGGLHVGNGLAAEIHMIVRSHGPALPGMVAEQISTFLGACDINLCEDQQALVFPPEA